MNLAGDAGAIPETSARAIVEEGMSSVEKLASSWIDSDERGRR